MHVYRRIVRTFALAGCACGVGISQAHHTPDNDSIFRGAFDPPALAQMEREIAIVDLPDQEDLNRPESTDHCGESPELPACRDIRVDFIGPEPLDFGINPTVPEYPEATVFSSDTGKTYWADVVAPDGPRSLVPLRDPNHASTGIAAGLNQYQWFVKRSATASMTFTISQTRLEIADFTGATTCPWYSPVIGTLEDCSRLLIATVEIAIAGVKEGHTNGSRFFPDETFFQSYGGATLTGIIPSLQFYTVVSANHRKIWDDANFQTEVLAPGHWTVTLRRPVRVTIPLDSIAVGETFLIQSELTVVADNLIGGESYVSAFFRDPISFQAGELSYDGVELTDGPVGFWPAGRQEPAEPCIDSNFSEDTIEFTSESFRTPEVPYAGGDIEIRRSGSGDGPASVYVSTQPDTATRHADYQPVRQHVVFEDGEVGVRVLRVPIVMDEHMESFERLTLSLTDPNGCATLGDQTTTELLILDDDTPPAQYTVGGTVSGLVGSGLVLSDALRPGPVAIDADGSFTMPGSYGRTSSYRVGVDQQPTDPFQECAVENGHGRVNDADVTDLQVICETITSNSAYLDPSFGQGGRAIGGLVEPNSTGGAQGVVVQPDGRILVAGGSKVRRLLASGLVDQSFGSAGEVALEPIIRSGIDVHGLALQHDGRVVVVGHIGSQLGSHTDALVLRLNADGSLDTTFGGGGVFERDIAGENDQAWDVAIQPDGHIVVGGWTRVERTIVPSVGDPFQAVDGGFLLIRLAPDGSLDENFAGDGVLDVDVDPRWNITVAHSLALQSDGRIVMAGSTEVRLPRDLKDVSLIRVTADGQLDASFGQGGVIIDETRDYDENAVRDVLVLPDGAIVTAGGIREPGGDLNGFLIARYSESGEPDVSFSVGRVIGAGLGQDAAATAVGLAPNGKILVAGVVGTSHVPQPPDFGLVRLNADGSIDETFADSGTLTIDFLGNYDEPTALVLQADNKWLVAGRAQSGSDFTLAIARLLP